MSKAFTKESDVDLPEVMTSRVVDRLPEGAVNYVTADGARRMREELEDLAAIDRPEGEAEEEVMGAAGQERRRREQRVRDLREMLKGAAVVANPEPEEEAAGMVRFGAFVRVRDGWGDKDTYRIVGVHEVDLRRGWVSWLSPMAKALLNKRVGETVILQVPAGETTLEILEVGYGGNSLASTTDRN